MLSSGPERVMVLWIPELDEELLRSAQADEARRGRRPRTQEEPGLAEERGRRWEQLLRSVEELIPGIESIRGGLCAARARGAARYYGGEADAAAALIICVSAHGIAAARVGIASGRFAAEQTARAAEGDPGIDAPSPGVRIVPDDATARLLAPLPVGRAAGEGLAEVLLGLGIRTLGAFAALPESAVRERFGPLGIAAHRRARGQAAAHAPEVLPREPVRDLTVRLSFEPPLDGTDQLAFACSAPAERLIRELVERGLVCTELRVELSDDIGIRHERQWAHPTRFTTADVVNRVRWQAGALPRDPERGGAGIAEVVFTPIRTARASEHEPGLWSTAPDERVHHHLSRVQSLLGHEGVGTGELTGGRLSSDRQRLVAWGTRPISQRSRTGPWPGRLLGAAPSAVFPEARMAVLLDRSGVAVRIDDEQLLSAEPARLGVAGRMLAAEVCGWSSPWPLRERWWRGRDRGSGAAHGSARDAASRSPDEPGRGSVRDAPPDPAQEPAPDARLYRVQLVLDDGDAWLLRYEADRGWAAEAHYA